jgi:adenine deaminase
VVADLHTFETIAAQWGRPDVVAAHLTEPGNRLVPFEWRMDWRRQGYVNKSGSLSERAAFMARLVKALSDANVGLLAGTDAPTIPGIGAGASLHVALGRLVAAGLSRYQALATATQAPGRYISDALGDAPAFGQVQPGFRADLVLSDANPLQDLKTLRTPAGVMRQGHWYGRAELDALLDEVRDDYSAVR